MSTQHQVILSLGSNQGNRLENLQNAIKCILNQASAGWCGSPCQSSASLTGLRVAAQGGG